MARSIKEIIQQYDDLHSASIMKPDKLDRRSWTIEVDDETSSIGGICENLCNLDFRMVTLRRDNDFFLGYRIVVDDDGNYEYFVDPRKSLHRNSPRKYVNGLMKYSVYSNDISETKNVSSFRVTAPEMKQKRIDNYLDLCYYYRDFSAIGTGITRNYRNIVLMDIDVNCEREDNKQALYDLLNTFGTYNALPDFMIVNHESKHVQLQWLVQSLEYKVINNPVYEGLIKQLENETNKNCEVKYNNTDFLKLSDIGIYYRYYTRAMTDIVKKHKFGDKNFTFWKAKNIYTALYRKQNLELKMPYFSNGEIGFLPEEDMLELLESKEARRQYYEEAPTFVELDNKTKDLIQPLIAKLNKKKIEKIKDEDTKDITEKLKPKQTTLQFENFKSYGTSRNNFVFNCTRDSTWQTAREMNFHNTKDITSLEDDEFKQFKNSVKQKVMKMFNDENDRYNGCWPDTSNHSSYSDDEFNATFNGSFRFAVNSLNASVYTTDQRQASAESRHLKKDMHLAVIDYLRQKDIMKRDELLTRANEILESSGQKKISFATLKRCINASKELTSEERHGLYKEFVTGVDERQKQLSIAQEKNSKRALDTYTKRYNYLNVSILDELRKMAHL